MSDHAGDCQVSGESARDTEARVPAVEVSSSRRRLRSIAQTLQPFRGIRKDVINRVPHYKTDWKDGWTPGIKIFAPATYIFFATTIPVLAFGQQMSIATDGILGVVQVLISTAATGLLQSVIGGQPLMIVGVSEPVTLVYGYAYSFAKDRSGLGPDLFLPWMAWVCCWTALIVISLAIFNANDYTNRITRLFGELFGVFTAVLFMQQAVKGALSEFRDDRTPLSEFAPEANEFQWRLSNGCWALIIAFGMVLTGLKVQQARSWRFFNSPIRGFLADYGVTTSVVIWSCMSYALSGAPPGIPRHMALPNTWKVTSNWSIASRMGEVQAGYIVGAIIPAILISILFYFDHTVSAHMAMLSEFNIRKESAYYYDLFLLGFMTAMCGLLGLPPVNGVLPQSPLHTRSLLTLRQQAVRSRFVRAAKAHTGNPEELLYKFAEECKAGGAEKAAAVLHDAHRSQDIKFLDALDVSKVANISEMLDTRVLPKLPLEAQEQRMSNFLQSLFTACCLGITPGIKKIPTSVLWGYFAYIACASLSGCEFWERFLLMFVETARRPPKFPGQGPSPWIGRVPWKIMVIFTLFQTVYCGACYAVTWIPIAGVVFPVPILLLIPIREYILPRFFGRKNLRYLDPAPYEDEDGFPLSKLKKKPGRGDEERSRRELEPATGVLQDEKDQPGGKSNSLENMSKDKVLPGPTIAHRGDIV